jgi:hypothetical protein
MVSPNAKMHRAKEHLDSLDEAIKRFIESKPYTVTSHEDLQSAHYVVNIAIGGDPLPMAMIASDAVAAMRSALDHLAWQLAMTTTDKPSTHTCFPVYELDTADTHVAIAKATFQIPDSAVTIVKSLQPYKAGKSYKTSPLWKLNKLWNVDKHRHLIFHSDQWDMPLSKTLPKELRPIEQRVFDNCCEMRFPLAAKEHLNLDPEVSISIAFGDLREGIEITAHELWDVHTFIECDVFPRFAGFFP